MAATGMAVSVGGNERATSIVDRTPASQVLGLLRFLNTPCGGVVMLIGTTLLARIILAKSMGLGIDESYMAAAGRSLHFGYFDHPPVAWWMAWLGELLGGPDNDLFIRLPFIGLFALSTWLMFRLTSELFDECAGLWAACALNAAPVLGITSGTWVLPDGPLIAALLGGTLYLVRAVRSSSRRSWPFWLAVGVCFGLAGASKYMAVPVMLGVGLYLVTTPSARVWLKRPQPYVAALIVFALLGPIVVWNVQHEFASLRFQGARAFGGRWHLLGPLTTLAGEALFFLPWLFMPLLFVLYKALRRGVAEPRTWLLVCLSLPSFLLFELVSLRSHVLFHWAAPALVLALPLLGHAIGQRRSTSRELRFAMIGTALMVVLGVTVVGSEVRFNWLPDVIEDFALGDDPDLAAVDWTSVFSDFGERGLLQPNTAFAAVRWLDAGKLDFALKGRFPVLCLGDDPREYGILAPVTSYFGQDVIIVAPRETLASLSKRFGRDFDAIEPLPSVILRHAGKPAMIIPVFRGKRLHGGTV